MTQGVKSPERIAIAALAQIVREEGRVCELWERCGHAGCASSYLAWAIATEALGEIKTIKRGNDNEQSGTA